MQCFFRQSVSTLHRRGWVRGGPTTPGRVRARHSVIRTDDSEWTLGQRLVVQLRRRYSDGFGATGSLLFSRNIDRVPFRAWGTRGVRLYFESAFAYLLGPSDPKRIALLSEPFLASAHEVLTRVIATPTKICTSGCSREAHAHSFGATATPSYSRVLSFCPRAYL